ncbi:hypothetical protein FRB97_009863, partial [Tulasnella sp. 331]
MTVWSERGGPGMMRWLSQVAGKARDLPNVSSASGLIYKKEPIADGATITPTWAAAISAANRWDSRPPKKATLIGVP